MAQHFNIGKKVEINPFESVNHFTFVNNIGVVLDKFIEKIHNKAEEVITRKRNGKFIILFNIELLNFVTLITWTRPLAGVFQVGHSKIYFYIEGDTMYIG